MISPKTIDTIFSVLKIEEVISDFINLKKRGVNLIGLCPFHDEKTPSFTVSPNKEIYKCFGCGKAGNAVTFLMEHEKYTYPQALVYLAKKYHIDIEEDETDDKYKAEQDDIESIYIVLGFAQNFYEEYLHKSEEGNTLGMAYFRERGFETDTIKKFNLGFSPSAYDSFSQAALKNGYKEEYLVESGMCIKTQDGRLIDRFRERVMFPIHSISGRTLGFGARTLKQSPNEAKYINSPETKVYSKGNVLYGFTQARNAVRKADFCFLVEGYTDVISLVQAGVENVVASLGTSMTENHVKIIKRLTNNLTFIFDGDNAGIKASFRGIDIGLKEGLNIKCVPLPEKEDPDSFSRKNSKMEVQDYVKMNSEEFILFKSKLLFKDKNPDPIQKAEGIRNIIHSILQIPNNISRSEYLRQLSKLTKIDEETLNRELNNQLRNKIKSQTEKAVPNTTVESPPAVKQRDVLLDSVSSEQEKKILQLLIEHGDKPFEEHTVAEEILENIREAEWENPAFKKVFDFYCSFHEENNIHPDLKLFLMHSDEEIRSITAELINPSQTLSQNWVNKTRLIIQTEFDFLKEMVYCLKHFELRKYYSLKKQNLIELKNPDLSDDEIERIQKTDKFIGEKINKISKELSVVYY